jgi:5S rRNA maturation endonuclease (ribonuclease M5)
VETALSLKEAGIKGTILASSGIHNIKSYKVVEGKITLLVDHDAEGSSARKTMDDIAKHFKNQGKDVQTLMPIKESQDFNDVLKEKGVEGVKACLTSEQPNTSPQASYRGKNKEPQHKEWSRAP